MKVSGASMADCPARKSENCRCFLRVGRKHRVADEIHAAMYGAKPPVRNPPRDLVRRNPTGEELPSGHTAFLSVGERPDDRVYRSSAGFRGHTQQNPEVDRGAPCVANESL